MRIVRDTVAQAHLKAVIVRATVDGKEVVTQAVGESMTGVPATTDMHFRNGAVAISVRVHTAAQARRREEGEPRRQAVEVAARRCHTPTGSRWASSLR